MAIPSPETPKTSSESPPPTPPVKRELAELSLDRLAWEVKTIPLKMREHLDQIKPVNYDEAPETQKNSIILTQVALVWLLTYVIEDMSDTEFAKLDLTGLDSQVTKQGTEKFSTLFGDQATRMISDYKLLTEKKDTPTAKAILASWDQMRSIASAHRAEIRKVSTASPASRTSTLPTGPVGEASTWDKTIDYVSDNKWKIAIGGALAIATYALFRSLGWEGSKDESKWLPAWMTDWKTLSLASLATAVGLYKWWPDWISGAFDKFKAFLLSEKNSTIEPAKITDMAKRIVEYNNKKNTSDRRNTFPEKLIKSKWGMTVAEFKDKDGFFSNVMYTVNSGISWLTGTSGVLWNDMKQEWNDYQLLLAYTKDKVAEYKIEVTDDTKMDDVWKKILEKEGNSK